jgi:hypothetical protein
MLAPLPASKWNEVTAAHLLNRAGFGGDPQQIADLHKMGMDRAVSYFVDYDKIPYSPPIPDWAHPDPNYVDKQRARGELMAAADIETKQAMTTNFFLNRRIENAELTYWWLRRMALGPRPFQEKMTLFWHGHFPSDIDKVNRNYLLYVQNEIFRQNALGNFQHLLTEVAHSPAMLIYLDGVQSHKNKPNENFAREVMELFALGEGCYTENDIKEAAKAYTGWGLSKDQQRFQYNPKDHNDGPKTVFGKTANYSGDELLGIIANRPECARFISKKIWRFFVQDEPPAPIVEALGNEFHSHGLDIKHLMNVIFRSEEFYAPDVIRAQIKSPVQWLIAGTHQLDTALPTKPMCLAILSLLGQELFEPPNVKGWVGGITWITTSSLLNRYNFAATLVEGGRVPVPTLEGQMKFVLNGVDDAGGLLEAPPPNVAALFTPVELSNADRFLEALQARFLNGTLRPARLDPLHDFLKTRSPIQEADIRKSVRLIMSTPEYQLT